MELSLHGLGLKGRNDRNCTPGKVGLAGGNISAGGISQTGGTTLKFPCRPTIRGNEHDGNLQTRVEYSQSYHCAFEIEIILR